jgi:hypothetical protein
MDEHGLMTDLVPKTIDPRRDSFNDGVNSELHTSDKQRKEGAAWAAWTVVGKVLAPKSSQPARTPQSPDCQENR